MTKTVEKAKLLEADDQREVIRRLFAEGPWLATSSASLMKWLRVLNQDFAKTLKRLSAGSERLIITNRNRPVAVLISVEHYRRLTTAAESESELEQGEAGHGSDRWGG